MRHRSYRKGNVSLNLRSEPILRLAFVDPWPLALVIYEKHVDWLRPERSEERTIFSELVAELHRDIDGARDGWMAEPMSEWKESSESLNTPLSTGVTKHSIVSPYRHMTMPGKAIVETVGPIPQLLSWWQSDPIFAFENVPLALAIRGQELIVERQDRKTYSLLISKLRTSVFSNNRQVCCHIFGRNQHVILPVEMSMNKELLMLQKKASP